MSAVTETQRHIVELPEAPSLGRVYADAGKKSALAAKRTTPVTRLPDVAHRVSGVRADRKQLTRYQRLMKDAVRDELPSVLVHGLAFPVAMSVMVRSDFPLPLLGVVHLKNRVEHRRRLDPSEILTVTAWAENLSAHHAGVQVDVVAEVSAGDEVVWRGVSTYLAKGQKLAGAERPERPERAEWVAPVKTGLWRLGADIGRAYASVLGDWNPIHLTAATAKVLGMKRHIAHGMYAAGRALATAAPHSGSGSGAYDWEIEFVAPVFLPGTVQFSARDADGGTEFAGWKRGGKRPHFTGSVTPR